MKPADGADCVKCGCNQMQPAGGDKRRCVECGHVQGNVKFKFKKKEIGPDLEDVPEFPELPEPGQEDTAPAGRKYLEIIPNYVMECPNCESQKHFVYKSQPPIRNHECLECGHRWKSYEAKPPKEKD